jgi:hypothetical protein
MHASVRAHAHSRRRRRACLHTPNRLPSVCAQGRLGQHSSHFKPDVSQGSGGSGSSRIVFELVEVVEQEEDVGAMDELLRTMYGAQVSVARFYIPILAFGSKAPAGRES